MKIIIGNISCFLSILQQCDIHVHYHYEDLAGWWGWGGVGWGRGDIVWYDIVLRGYLPKKAYHGRYCLGIMSNSHCFPVRDCLGMCSKCLEYIRGVGSQGILPKRVKFWGYNSMGILSEWWSRTTTQELCLTGTNVYVSLTLSISITALFVGSSSSLRKWMGTLAPRPLQELVK